MTKLTIVAGPPTKDVTREVAEQALRAHPQFPKNASVALDEVEGVWVAAIAIEDSTKTAAPFPPSGDGGSNTDDGGSSGPPAPDAGSDDADSGEGPPSDEEGPPKEDKPEKGEKGLEHQIHALTEMVHTIVEALGLAPSPADSMMPGADMPGAGPPGGPPGAGGPPGPHAGGPGQGAGPDGQQHIVHERAMKPGMAQPGSTPVGAPAFASVADDHPWKEVIAQGVEEFEAEEVISDEESLAAVQAEIDQLAAGTGYKLKGLKDARNENGQRVAHVRIGR
jgi:hypothetical protein